MDAPPSDVCERVTRLSVRTKTTKSTPQSVTPTSIDPTTDPTLGHCDMCENPLAVMDTSSGVPMTKEQIAPRGLCGICQKRVSSRAKTVKCQTCSTPVHTKCDSTLPPEAVLLINNDNYPGVCYVCSRCLVKCASDSEVSQPSVSPPEKTLEDRMASLELQFMQLQKLMKPATNRELKHSMVSGVGRLPPTSRPPAHTTQERSPIICSVKISESAAPLQKRSMAQSNDNKRPVPKAGNKSSVKQTQSGSTKTLNTHSKSTRMPKATHTFSVICSNIQESKESLFEHKKQHDLHEWFKLCANMNIAHVIPLSLIRLSRLPSSPHRDKPRLLRVTLPSEKDMENVLLHAYLLNNLPDSEFRISADIPWWERKPVSTGLDRTNSRTLVLLGVPESAGSPSPHERLEHDYKQWRFIASSINASEAVVVDTFRIPKSTNYKGDGPKPLKVTFLTSGMTEAIKIKWKTNKNKLPKDVRLSFPKTDSPRVSNDVSMTTRSDSGVQQDNTDSDSGAQQDSIEHLSKNGHCPTHHEPDN